MNRNTRDLVGDVEDFHERFGLRYSGAPRALDEELASFRATFLAEELYEYYHHAAAIKQSIKDGDDASTTHHLAQMLDSLVDLVYVAMGTAHLHGFDFREAWARVHVANMAKVRAERASDSKRGTTFDVVKPPGWEAPRHEDLVEHHIHRAPR